jgi:hypothetical protein
MNQTPPTIERRPAKRVIRYGLFGAACLATLLALAYVEENWRGRRAWQAHQRECEAKGEKFSLAELIPPPIPEEKNFAMMPLLKPVLDLTHGPEGVIWHDTNGWARLLGFNATLPPGRSSTNNLDLPSVEQGTFADLEAWRAFYRDNTNYPAAAAEASAAESVLTALGKFHAEFRELREASATRPYSRFPVQYEEQPPYGILLPHLARIKVMASAVQIRATAELEAGRSTEALEDLKVGLRLSESIHDEPIVISHLVRVVTLGSAVQTIREGLVRHAWTDAQLADVQARLGSVNLLAEYKAAMRAERAATVAEMDYLRQHGDWGVDLTQFFGQSAATYGRILHWGPSGWIYQNLLTFSRITQESTLPAANESARRLDPELSEAGTRVLQTRPEPYTLVARLLQSEPEKVLQRSGRMQTFADAAIVGCALERYRLANNRLPDALTPLTPQLCERIPNDVIDGQPLRWHRNADGGYALYSVGWNKRDEGGALGWNQTADTGFNGLFKQTRVPWVDPAKGDWAWEMPAGNSPMKSVK